MQLFVKYNMKPFITAFSLAMLLLLSQDIRAKELQPRIFQHGTTPIVALRFTPDGDKLISASRDGAVVMWALETQQPQWQISLRRPPRSKDYTHVTINALDLSPDGLMIAVSYVRSGVDRNLVDEKLGDTGTQGDTVWEPHIILIDARDGSIEKDIQNIQDRVTDLAFFSTGEHLLLATTTVGVGAIRIGQSPTNLLHILSVNTGRQVQSFNSKATYAKVALSPDGNHFAVAGYQLIIGEAPTCIVEVYNTKTAQLLHRLSYRGKQIPTLRFSSDSRFLATAGSVKRGVQIQILVIEENRAIPTVVSLKEFDVSGIAFISNGGSFRLAGGTLLKIGMDDVGSSLFKDKGGAIVEFEVGTNKKLYSHKFRSFVTSFAQMANGSKMAVGMYNGQVAVVESSV